MANSRAQRRRPIGEGIVPQALYRGISLRDAREDHTHGDPQHSELHTIASHSDTTATGAELETLTDGVSDADALHKHYIPMVGDGDTGSWRFTQSGNDLVLQVNQGTLAAPSWVDSSAWRTADYP